MSTRDLRRAVAGGGALAALSMTGCSRAPSFDILGSFFPAWLVCFAASLLVTAVIRSLLQRLHVVLAFPVVAWPSLIALVTFALWLSFFS
jgi:hypothetical protein